MSDRCALTNSVNFLGLVIFFVSELLWVFQAAVYGLGVCAEFGGSVFKPLVGGKFIYLSQKRVCFAEYHFLMNFHRGSVKVKCCIATS